VASRSAWICRNNYGIIRRGKMIMMIMMRRRKGNSNIKKGRRVGRGI